ncbi:Uncharacterised protein [Vibrio cholerae]|nr:Uncharacterised protein [Vibrio cholerae]CSC88401.1 Uncharacterised protein [Vibrio cholerae]
MPSGTMNILATQCSKPLETNIATGMMVMAALVMAFAELKVSQIAKQTSRLHRMPKAKACTVV